MGQATQGHKVDPALKMRTLMILTDHIGALNAVGMGELYELATGSTWKNRINDTRIIRTVIEQLRHEGQRICSSPARDGGYYLASAASELVDYLRKNKSRALKALAMNSAMLRVSLPELLGQMKLELEGGADNDAETAG
jgi:hypothetical protein